MSLTSLIKTSTIREILDPLVAAILRPEREAVRHPPRSRNHSLVGTAFDYLFRFELQRRNPAARDQEWVAETAIAMSGLLGPKEGTDSAAHWQMADAARAALAAHRTQAAVDSLQLAEMARHALRLANVDAVFRSGRAVAGFTEIGPSDVEDLVDLVGAVPWAAFASNGPVFLNPVFPEVSPRVGGADADLLVGDCLIDLKVVQSWVSKQDLRQLVGYYLLARAQQAEDGTFPVPN